MVDQGGRHDRNGQLPFARVGFNVCYEAEIPECAASLTVPLREMLSDFRAEQGAELILRPSLTFTEYGFWHVRHSAQARAIENDDTGECHYWEHLGLLHTPDHETRWNRKLEAYRGACIPPHDEGGGRTGTLIVTRDNERGGIDTRVIADLVSNVFAG